SRRQSHTSENVAFERWCWIGCKHKCRSLAATTLADYDLPTVLGLTDTTLTTALPKEVARRLALMDAGKEAPLFLPAHLFALVFKP
ncbi:MAG: hypothetical protein NTV80_09685, partial [Verrucomicrobia bacterium]|nr:hypothetical protein [Verrucomicrobiota bacterium]